MAFKDNAVELEERVVAINRVTKVVKFHKKLLKKALPERVEFLCTPS